MLKRFLSKTKHFIKVLLFFGKVKVISYDDFKYHLSRKQYHSTDLLEAVIDGTKLLVQEPLSNKDADSILVILLQVYVSRLHSGLRVLDFGGGAGRHYFEVRQMIHFECSKWIVIETPAMVEKCKRSFNDQNCIEWLNSFSEIECPPDIIYSNAAIQYSGSALRVFEDMLKIGAPIICLERLFTNQFEHNYVLQTSKVNANGPRLNGIKGDISYPFEVLTRVEVNSIAARYFYNVLWLNEHPDVFPNPRIHIQSDACLLTKK